MQKGEAVSFWATLLLVVVLLVGAGLAFLGVCFYYYVKALEEAHRDGWDMPN